VFINILGHDEIDLPELKDMPSQVLTEHSREGVRIPLSMSDMKESFDHRKDACRVVDVAFNTEVAKGAKEDQVYRNMLIGIIFERFKEKFQLEMREE